MSGVGFDIASLRPLVPGVNGHDLVLECNACIEKRLGRLQGLAERLGRISLDHWHKWVLTLGVNVALAGAGRRVPTHGDVGKVRLA